VTKRQTTTSPPAPAFSAATALVVGVDAGGTTTRALVTALDGERLGDGCHVVDAATLRCVAR
jgi:N-acetylglucosamine kinase-like BadF-type ATPase